MCCGTFVYVIKWLEQLSVLSDSTYWDAAIWIEVGKWNEKWMAISCCFFTVPNMSSIQRETKNFSEHQNPVNHDLYLVPATDKLHPALLMKVTDVPPKAPRLMTSDRRATSPNSKPSAGEKGASSSGALSSKGRCVQSIHFQTIPDTHHHFILPPIFQRKIFGIILCEFEYLF